MAKRDMVLDDNKIREYVGQGMTVRQIAEAMGISKPTARKNILRLGLQPISWQHPKKSNLTKKDYEEALEFCFTANDLAEHFDINVSTVRRKLDEFGLEPRTIRKRNEFIKSEEEYDLDKCEYAVYDHSIKKVTIQGKKYLDITDAICDL